MDSRYQIAFLYPGINPIENKSFKGLLETLPTDRIEPRLRPVKIQRRTIFDLLYLEVSLELNFCKEKNLK